MRRIDENHSFNRAVAKAEGMEKAVLLKEIYGWCHINLAKGHNVVGGRAYTRMTAAAFAEKFDYMNQKSIARWLLEMERDCWLVGAALNEKGYDKTKSYFVNHERYDAVVMGESYPVESAEKWAAEVRDMLKLFAGAISQNEKSISYFEPSISQNEPSISQNEPSISQNEEPIPPTTHLLHNSTLKGGESEKNDGAEALPSLRSLKGLELKKAAKAEILDWIEKHPDGIALWKDAKDTYGYTGEPGPIFFEWVGNQPDYVLWTWKENIHKIGSYVSNKARSEFRAQAKRNGGGWGQAAGETPPPPVKRKEEAGISMPRW